MNENADLIDIRHHYISVKGTWQQEVFLPSPMKEMSSPINQMASQVMPSNLCMKFPSDIFPSSRQKEIDSLNRVFRDFLTGKRFNQGNSCIFWDHIVWCGNGRGLSLFDCQVYK